MKTEYTNPPGKAIPKYMNMVTRDRVMEDSMGTPICEKSRKYMPSRKPTPLMVNGIATAMLMSGTKTRNSRKGALICMAMAATHTEEMEITCITRDRPVVRSTSGMFCLKRVTPS